VDDEIGEGNAIRGMLDLLLVLNPGIDSIIIVAEDGGFAGPAEIRGIKAAFIASRKRPANIYNAMSYTVPQEFREPLMWALKSEPDLNNKHLMCTLLGLPTKEFNDGKPAFNDRLIEQARRAIPNLAELQQGYQAHFIKTIADSLR
jgi:hypothetical protein